MAWRSDSTHLVPAGWTSSRYAGHGVRGADIPQTGQHGGAMQAEHVNLPAEADNEFRFVVLTAPPLLTLFAYDEDGVIVAEGPPGVHTGTAEGFMDGASYGTFDFDIIFGSIIGGDAVMPGPSAAGELTGGTPSALAGDAALPGPSAGGGLSGGAPTTLTGDAQMPAPSADGGLSGGGASALSGDAAMPGPTAAGGLASLPDSSLAGDAVMPGPTAGGELSGGVASALSGDATMPGPAAGGGLDAGGQSALFGDAALPAPSASGGAASQPSELSGDAMLPAPGASGGASGYSMTLIEALFALLNPLAPGGAHYMMNDGDPTTRGYPFIVFQRIAHTPNATLRSGPSRYQNTRVQIDIHGRTIAEVEDVERLVESAMHNWTEKVRHVSDVDLFDEASRMYRVAKDYSIWSRMT